MGPIWVLSAPGGPHVGPTNLAIRDDLLLSVMPILLVDTLFHSVTCQCIATMTHVFGIWLVILFPRMFCVIDNVSLIYTDLTWHFTEFTIHDKTIIVTCVKRLCFNSHGVRPSAASMPTLASLALQWYHMSAMASKITCNSTVCSIACPA